MYGAILSIDSKTEEIPEGEKMTKTELDKRVAEAIAKAEALNDSRDAIIAGRRYSASDLDYLPGWMSDEQYRIND